MCVLIEKNIYDKFITYVSPENDDEKIVYSVAAMARACARTRFSYSKRF